MKSRETMPTNISDGSLRSVQQILWKMVPPTPKKSEPKRQPHYVVVYSEPPCRACDQQQRCADEVIACAAYYVYAQTEVDRPERRIALKDERSPNKQWFERAMTGRKW